MRFPFLLLFLTGWSLADDNSVCLSNCNENYASADVKAACLAGCSARSGSSSTSGIPVFYSCHGKCDRTYAAAESRPMADACHHACALPYTSSVVMTLDTTGDHPQWKVIEKTGDDVIMPSFLDPEYSDEFTGKNPLSDLLDLRAPSALSAPNSQMMRMNEEMESRMRHLMEAFSRKFVEDVRRQMGEQKEGGAKERPSGHELWAREGPTVLNMAPDGSNIIESRPVGEQEGGNGIVIEFRRRLSSHPFSHAFHFLFIVLGCSIILGILCVTLLVVRNMRINAYRRMGPNGFLPVFGRVQKCDKGMATPCEKKVPLEGWFETAQPAGVPPPAYDQVSIHSLRKNTDSEASTSGADTPSPQH